MDAWSIFLLAIAGGAGAVLRYLVHAGFIGPRPPRPRAQAPLPGFPGGAFPGYPGQIFAPPPRPGRRARAWADPDWRLLAVNAAASLLAGFATAAIAGPWGVILATGLCGGLSTWSTLMNDARIHLAKGRMGRGVGVVALTLAVSLLAAWLGYGAAWLLAQV